MQSSLVTQGRNLCVAEMLNHEDGYTHLLFIDSDIDIRLLTGPEILAGSTRLKAGTATKMALNIISTSVMIKLGKVYGNRMIDLAVTNNKLFDRAVGILFDIGSVDKNEAIELLKLTNGSVKLSLLIALSNLDVIQAKKLLDQSQGNLRTVLSNIRSKSSQY